MFLENSTKRFQNIPLTMRGFCPLTASLITQHDLQSPTQPAVTDQLGMQSSITYMFKQSRVFKTRVMVYRLVIPRVVSAGPL